MAHSQSPPRPQRRPRLLLRPLVALGLLLGLSPTATAQVAATLNDLHQWGTQPGDLSAPLQSASSVCASCHGNYDVEDEPFTRWSASMMAQSARDPIFHACLAIANQDVAFAGELCIRCHAPLGWLGGNSTPTDASSLTGSDFEGVSCHFCHRLVDPVADPANPVPDTGILAALSTPVPTDPHSGQYVVDPEDRRRGPFDLGPGFPYHSWEQSPYHRESKLCGTCHDVSNPLFDRVGGAVPKASDVYVLNTLDKPHTTQNKYDEFPIERTYSEWLMSSFAQGPVEMGGLFGGNKTAVSTCQDCHLPDTSGTACKPGLGGAQRDDLPQHDFNGANSWVLNAILDLDQNHLLYGPAEASGLTQAAVNDAIQRNKDMLSKAAELKLATQAGELFVQVINNGGHKLPTGYSEGRRMWLNIQFLNDAGTIVAEHGAYDNATATLTTADTEVYEMEMGLDAATAAATGVPAGPGFHFVLSNKVYKDNRIPPRGFTNSNFEAIQAAPVDKVYPDGQFWDDVSFDLPCGATQVAVSLFHQTTSREYIEFLRAENHTNNAGDIAYDLWATHGRSAPVLMAQQSLPLGARLTGDVGEISLSSGGAQSLCMTAGSANAGDVYLVLGSASGTAPGIPLAGQPNLPLNFDGYLALTLNSPNTPPLSGSLGVLSGSGESNTSLTVPAGTVAPGAIGLTLNHAAVLLDPFSLQFTLVSNAAPLLLAL